MRQILLLATALVLAAPAFAQPKIGPDPKEVQAVVDKAYEFLKSRQKPDGSFEPARGRAGHNGPDRGRAHPARQTDRRPGRREGPRVPREERPEGRRRLRQGPGQLHDQPRHDGVQGGEQGGKYDTIIANAAEVPQVAPARRAGRELPFGGVGYDGKSRPDMSNTHFFVEALIAAGVPKDDPAIKNALIFLSRCQNLPGEANKQAFAKKATEEDKGGFVYNPFDATNEKSDKRTAEGGLRTEGGMTYAGLKSFLYAGVGKDDPRVKAAIGLDPQALHAGGEPRAEGRGAVLLLPHVRQGDGRPGRGPVRGRQGHEARLAEGAVRRAQEQAGGGRQLGEQERGVPGEHPGAGHGVRAVVAELCDEEVRHG